MEILYAIDKKGKIRVFQAEISLSGPATPNTASYNTATGTLGGKLSYKKTIIVNGKQGRSVNQQATMEVEALYKEKRDDGYKSLSELEQRYKTLHGDAMFTGAYLSASESDKVEAMFKALNIQFNTNSDWLPLVMLAEKFRDVKKKIKYPQLAQPKLNGVRCITLLHEGKIVHLSRGGMFYLIPHITEALKSWFDTYPNLVLDGELYKHGEPLQLLSGIARLEDPAEFGRKHLLEYHIYDLAMPNMTQADRHDALKKLPNLAHLSIKMVQTMQVDTESLAMTLHDKYVAEGYEGAILRDPSAVYQFGFRDSCLVKIKEFLDEEFIIIGHEIDDVSDIDSFVFVLKNNVNDLTFKARPTGNREEKQIWLEKIDTLIGKKATIRYQERTVDGLPHQAHVRHKDSVLLIEAIRDYE